MTQLPLPFPEPMEHPSGCTCIFNQIERHALQEETAPSDSEASGQTPDAGGGDVRDAEEVR